MKKILCLLLTFVLVFAFASCDKLSKDDGKNDTNDNVNNNDTNNDNTNDNNDNAPVDPFVAFENAIATSDASTVVVDVVTITALGELDAHYEVIFNDNGGAVIRYTYERFYEIGEGDGNETTYEVGPVTVYRDKDGNYSENIGVDIAGIEPALAFDIASLKDSAKINEIGDELNVTIPKTNTLNLLGSQFSSDVQLKIALRSGKLSKIIIASTDRTITYNYQ